MVIASGIALCLGGSASAEPAFDEFASVCLPHKADRAGTLAAAGSSGWTTRRPDTEPALGPEAGDLDFRLKDAGAGSLLLIVGRQTRKIFGQDAARDICAIVASPGNRMELEAAVGKLAGVPALPDGQGQDWFIWRSEGTKHVAVAPPTQLGSLGDDVNVLVVSGHSGQASVGLIAPSK